MEHTTFIIERGIYCYKVIPFSLKNAGATYQRLINKMFINLLGKTVEAYIDDMVIKSKQVVNHIQHVDKVFKIFKKYEMRLNPLKYVFGPNSYFLFYPSSGTAGIMPQPFPIRVRRHGPARGFNVMTRSNGLPQVLL